MSDFAETIKKNTLKSDIFLKNVIDIAAFYALEKNNSELPINEKCNKLFALSLILHRIYQGFEKEEKRIFDFELNNLIKKLEGKTKTDTAEQALSKPLSTYTMHP